MKHKLTISRSLIGRAGTSTHLWYVVCDCGWDPPLANHYFGRETWAEAFALGVTHQKNEETRERLRAMIDALEVSDV